MITTSQFFEHMQCIYLRCSLSGNILDANAYAADVSGIEHNQLVNQNLINLFHPEDKTTVLNILNMSTDSSPGHQHIHRWAKANGSYLWLKWQWTRPNDAAEIYIMGEDISEQKRTKSAFLALEHVTNTGYWEIDLSTKVLYWSEKVHQIHETDSRTFKPNIDDGLKFYAHESVPPLMEALETLENTGEPYDLELAFKSDKGKALTVNAQGFSEIERGTVVRSFGTFKDLTQSKEDEAARHSLEQRIMLALEAAQIGVWEYDFEADALIWDDRLLEMFGKPPKTNNLCFHDWRAIVHHDDLDAAQRNFEEAIAAHKHFNHTFRIVTDTGEIKHILGMAAASYNKDGIPIRATGVNIDLTASEQAKTDLKNAINEAQENAVLAKTMAQKAKAADVQKSAFLANMSHEIRTPISGIMGLLDLLRDINSLPHDEANKAESERYLTLAKNTSVHLLRIIGDILDFSKIEAGKIVLQETSFDLYTLLEDLMSGFELQTKERGLFLDYQSHGIDSKLVIGDEIRLKQILYNLLSNAMKFTDDGGLTIRARINQKDAEQAIFICSINDTGCGIDHAQLSQLFTPFEQLDSSSTKSSQGTGLGLSISNELAMLMGGKISVNSEKGKGSTFTLQLPFSIPQARQTTSLQAPDAFDNECSTKDLSGTKVLVVEDNEINQVIVANMLSQFNIEYALAEDGMAALEMLKSYPENYFDVILMDCQMPRLDGYETTSTIRNSPAMRKYADISIIALTANAMVGDKQKCIDAGMDDYMAKPIDKSLLYKKLLDIKS